MIKLLNNKWFSVRPYLLEQKIEGFIPLQRDAENSVEILSQPFDIAF